MHQSLDADDTIAAVITPPGTGGIAAIRLAGPDSLKILRRHFSFTRRSTGKIMPPYLMRRGQFCTVPGEILDDVMAVFMPHGQSYTGSEQVEIFCHGGRHIVHRILGTLLESGARAAQPGEFTRRAFLNGRIDLARAEGVAEVIAADTEQSYRSGLAHLLGAYSLHIEKLRAQMIKVMAEIEASIDFSDEEINPDETMQLVKRMRTIEKQIRVLLDSYSGGRIVKEGYRIAIAGRPNAGKSSLFNLLLKQERALVAPTAGTTRDYLSEWIDLDGIPVSLTDTAGLRRGGSRIEKAGQASAKKIMDDSDMVLWLCDMSDKTWIKHLAYDRRQLSHGNILLVANKIDIASRRSLDSIENNMHAISCLNKTGIRKLKQRISSIIQKNLPDYTSGHVVTSARHKQKLSTAAKSIRTASRKLRLNESPEIVAFDLRSAINSLDEITGRVYNEEILGKIFSTFCIGK